MTADTDASTHPLVTAQGIHHVRLTVTDIGRSKAFYSQLFGVAPAMDHSDLAGDPAAVADPARLFAGCIFQLGNQLFGLRPAAQAGDTFDSTRVGLDHVSLGVDSLQELQATAQRLDDAGIPNGGVTDLGDMGMAILSIQDPDDINLELISSN